MNTAAPDLLTNSSSRAFADGHDGTDGVMHDPPPGAVYEPQIRLSGRIDEVMLQSLRDQIASVPSSEGPIAVELMSFGGDAELGRRLALEVRLSASRLRRRFLFVGKTAVYSAGTTFMGGFDPADRFVTDDCVLLIHCRQLEMTLQLAGPLRGSEQRVQEVLEQIRNGIRLQQDGYAALIRGTEIGMEEVTEKAAVGWYVTAEEALRRGLVAGVV